MSPDQILYLKQLQLGPMQNFVYLLGAAGAKEVAVVDPAWDEAALEEQLARDGKELACVILTHSHPDHLNALEEVLRLHPVPVWVQADELEVAPFLESLGPLLRKASPDEVVKVGPLEVKLLATPGHTPGAQCLLAAGALLSGDTVFVNACGRVDLPGSDPEAMFHSLTRLAQLPGETRLYPGHDYGDVPVSSIAREKEKNPYFQFKELGGFLAFR
ncbi:MAG: MBL fold metallo-hydrolase [Myxococcaceae bacterium]